MTWGNQFPFCARASSPFQWRDFILRAEMTPYQNPHPSQDTILPISEPLSWYPPSLLMLNSRSYPPSSAKDWFILLLIIGVFVTKEACLPFYIELCLLSHVHIGLKLLLHLLSIFAWWNTLVQCSLTDGTRTLAPNSELHVRPHYQCWHRLV